MELSAVSDSLQLQLHEFIAQRIGLHFPRNRWGDLQQAKKLQHILEKHGYQVTIATDGLVALETAQRHKPTLIISDVVMPEMDGYELCRRVKSSTKLADVPVILVTTLSDPQDVIRGLECQADNFILKPYDERYLLGSIQFVLINREMRRTDQPGLGLEIYFEGQKHFISADRLQILNLLLSTYEAGMQRNKQLSLAQDTLQQTNSELQQLTVELEHRVHERTQELRLYSARLERCNRELQDFVQVGSHDLQEPLRKILSFGERLKSKAGEALDEESQDYLQRMTNAAARMQSLITDLMTFSRVETNSQWITASGLTRSTSTASSLSPKEQLYSCRTLERCNLTNSCSTFSVKSTPRDPIGNRSANIRTVLI